jgi:hypothetical protein
MKRINVNSSSIKSIGYDLTNTLEIEFSRGAIYQYKKVSAGEVCDLIFSESIGKYFDQNIKKKYIGEKIND